MSNAPEAVRPLPPRSSGAPIADLAPAPAPVSVPEAFRYWLKLGFVSFGGPAGQISMMHTELVERRRWISEHRFLRALDDTMVLPGPQAQQLATSIGGLMHGTLEGMMAGVLFDLPSLAILIALTVINPASGDLSVVAIFALQVPFPAIMHCRLPSRVPARGTARRRGPDSNRRP